MHDDEQSVMKSGKQIDNFTWIGYKLIFVLKVFLIFSGGGGGGFKPSPNLLSAYATGETTMLSESYIVFLTVPPVIR